MSIYVSYIYFMADILEAAARATPPSNCLATGDFRLLQRAVILREKSNQTESLRDFKQDFKHRMSRIVFII